MDRIRKYRRVVSLAALAAAAVLLLPTLSAITVEELLTYTPKYPILAAAVLLSLYGLKALVWAGPMTVLYIGAGIMFPPVRAIAVTYAGLICETAIGYWVGRHMGSERVLASVGKNEKISRLAGYLNRHGSVVIFIARLIPGPLPFDIISWLFGASRVGFSRHMAYSLLGVSPAMLPLVLAGNSLLNPLSKEFLLPFLAGALIAAGLLLFLWSLERKHALSIKTLPGHRIHKNR